MASISSSNQQWYKGDVCGLIRRSMRWRCAISYRWFPQGKIKWRCGIDSCWSPFPKGALDGGVTLTVADSSTETLGGGVASTVFDFSKETWGGGVVSYVADNSKAGSVGNVTPFSFLSDDKGRLLLPFLFTCKTATVPLYISLASQDLWSYTNCFLGHGHQIW